MTSAGGQPGDPDKASDGDTGQAAISNRRARLLLAGTSLWIATEAMLLQPLGAAATNAAELSASLAAIAAELLAPWASVAAVAILGFQLMALRAPVRALALACAIALAQWLQGHVLLWDYGVLDGSPIDWSATPLRTLVELAAWAALVGLAIARPRVLAGRAGTVVAAVAALELAAFASAWSHYQAAPSASQPPTAEEPTGLSSFSRAGDAILIVLDTLPPDIFAEALEDPQLRAAIPPGMTFFPDALAHHVTTDWSAQSLLTGQHVPIDLAPNPARRSGWVRDQIEDSAIGGHATAGGDVRIATFRPVSIACSSLPHPMVCRRNSDWLRGARAASEAREDANAMLRVGWFRASPQPLKARLYSAGRWRVDPLAITPTLAPSEEIHELSRDDLGLLRSLQASASAESGARRFRMIHLFGTHQPATLDAACEARSIEPRREATVATARCLLGHVFGLLARLDELGVYDPATIVIASDHGHPTLAFDPTKLGHPALAASSPARARATKFDWGVPLLLAKPPGARHDLRTSERPVALCDVATTLSEALGQLAELPCPSLFDTATQRPARVHLRRGRPPGRRHERLLRYEVGSPAWDPKAWTYIDPEQR